VPYLAYDGWRYLQCTRERGIVLQLHPFAQRIE